MVLHARNKFAATLLAAWARAFGGMAERRIAPATAGM